MNVDLSWCRDEVVVGNCLFYVFTYPCALVFWCCDFVDHFNWDVPPHPLLCVRVGEDAWTMQYRVEERGSQIWAMVRTWERSTFRLVCVAVWSRFSANATLEATILGKFWMLLVQTHLLCLCMVVRMFFQRLLQAVWEVGTVSSLLITPHLISGC